MATEDWNTVKVYTINDQCSGELAQVASRFGVSPESLGGYISVVLATHLSMTKKPKNTLELQELVKNLSGIADITMVDSCARMIAMIKQRRMTYYKSHRREFVPDSLAEENLKEMKGLGKYGDRLHLHEYMTAPMSEADMTYALTHMMGFAGNRVAVLRSCKEEPAVFTTPTSTGFKGAEEHRAAFIQQRAFFGSSIFVETTRIRDAGDYSLDGSNSCGDRVDGQPSVHDTGCGLQTVCYPITTHLKGLDESVPVCSPFIIDVGGSKAPQIVNSGSIFDFSASPATVPRGKGHYVCGLPVSFEGQKFLVIFDSMHRKPSYKSEGVIYTTERLLANALVSTIPLSPTKFPVTHDYTEETVHSKAFSHRRCKICHVIHASDMHSEFQ